MSERSQLPAGLRKLVLERHEYQCATCPAVGEEAGGDETLHIHHRKPHSEGGEDEMSNLTVLCSDCHHHFHSSRTAPDEVQTDLDEYDLSTTPADYKLVAAIEAIAPASTSDLADEASISYEHGRRRLYALAAADVVARGVDGEWDLADLVEESAKGRLPESPDRAARFGRDSVIRRMKEYGMSYRKISAVVGLDERTIPVAVNRARALDPPVPPAPTGEPDIGDIEQRLVSLERQLDELS